MKDLAFDKLYSNEYFLAKIQDFRTRVHEFRTIWNARGLDGASRTKPRKKSSSAKAISSKTRKEATR